MKTQSHSATAPTSRTASHDLPGEQPTQRLLGYGAIAALGALALTLFLAACSRDAKPADSSSAMMTSGATGDSAKVSGMPMAGMGGMKGKEGMSGMNGMNGMNGMMGMMTEMNTHMQGMMKASGEQMKGMMPAHRQMTANMLAEMNAEMKKMNMSGDAGWNALADSVRQDLTHLPEMSARELADVMPAHQARMMRLMQMHQAMTKNMKM